MNNKYFVTAIVSTYNSEKFIRGKIEDLLSQTIGERLEIVIVNSGSRQNEDAIIQEYLGAHSNIKYIKTEDRETIYRAWNRAIRVAQGKYITNANTDDRLRTDAFQILSVFLDENPDMALVYGDQLLTDVENQKYKYAIGNKVIRFPDYSHFRQLERCIIGSQPMWRASLHTEDNIWFDDRYEVCGDHEFELKISEKYRIQHLSITLGTFYKSPERSNKEFENPDRTKREVNELTTLHLKKYINNCSEKELATIQNEFEVKIFLPILIYELVKRIEKFLFPDIYPKYFFHSIEFVYFLNILIYEKKGDFEKCILLCKKYLRYKKSERIYQKYLRFLSEVRKSEQ